MTDVEDGDENPQQRFLDMSRAFKILARYRIETGQLEFDPEGQRFVGGYGEVTKAVFRPAGEGRKPRSVAVKMLTRWSTNNDEEMKRLFARELLVLAEVNHPNATKLLGFHDDFANAEAWLVVPWEANGNIMDFLEKREFEVPERLSLLHDAAMGLEYLHSHSPPIVHGDLKSANILVNTRRRAVLSDFGLARIRGDGIFERIEGTGNSCSVRWASPELLNGEGRDTRSDMWAFGWVAWELVTGELPYQDIQADFAVILKILTEPNPEMHWRFNDVLAIWDMMRGCWAEDPDQRASADRSERVLRLLPRCVPRSVTDELGEDANSGELLSSLGALKYWRGCPEEALELLNEALSIYCKDDNGMGQASVLRHLGNVHRAQNRYDAALQAFHGALQRYRVLNDEYGIANSLHNIGSVNILQFHISDAILVLDEALSRHRCTGNSLGIAVALTELGTAYSLQARYDEALATLDEALAVRRGAWDDAGVVNTLTQIAEVYRIRGRLDDARTVLEDAIATSRRLGYLLGLGNALRVSGDLHVAGCRFSEATSHLNEAMATCERIQYGLGIVSIHQSLGTLYLLQGRPEDALLSFTKALEKSRNQTYDGGAANALKGLGRVYNQMQNRYPDAFVVLDEALSIVRGTGSELGIINTLKDLGDTYRLAARHDDAINALSESISKSRSIGYHVGVANGLRALGDVLQERGDHVQAIATLQDAIDAARSIRYDIGVANALSSLGRSYASQSRFGEAINVLEEASRINAKTSQFTAMAECSSRLARVRRQQREQEADEDLHGIFKQYRVQFTQTFQEPSTLTSGSKFNTVSAED
ncbi:hypothetical protein FRC04_008022 [Tulasnella sp. 424]|nr:hypothetical protein FRC04_008022 [Tulasnella sp. 424]KAG8974880.1 hypothetical protein FRC05_006813 [Tulasnella sp. 425]